jgi:hypothetical protein
VFIKGIKRLFDQFVSVVEVARLKARGQALHKFGLLDFNIQFRAPLSS